MDAHASRPNVLLILSDDQAWNDYSFMGHEDIRTPNLDQLARESATFQRGYVPTALCRPSLASIITGLYPHQHGITGNDPAIPVGLRGNARKDPDYLAKCEQLISKLDQQTTLAEILRDHGYRTLQTGKWWEGSYERGGFEFGMTHGDPDRGGRHGDEGLKIARNGLKPIYDFIEADTERPFFIWHAPFLPHTPHNPPQRFLEKYQKEGRPIQLARYYAMCEWFDETCGELFDYLEQNNLKDNTLVVYVTDNGWIQMTPQVDAPQGWNKGFAPRSKQSPYEGGVRTPIMFRLPGQIQPRMDDKTLVSSIDLMPTILDLCDIAAPQDLPGISLVPVIHGKELDRDIVFGEGFAHDVADINDPSASLLYRWCIEGSWKLIVFHDGKTGRNANVHRRDNLKPELYNVTDDPFEKNNLAAKHPDIVERLSKELDANWDPEAAK